jgi:putative endopeptidase
MNHRVATLLSVCVLAFVLPALAAEHGVHTEQMDTSVGACKDFYEYANGAWLKTSSIPPEYSAWGAFHEVYERNLKLLKTVLEDAAADTSAPQGSVRRKVGDFYAAAMNETRAEEQGVRALASRLAALDALRTPKDLAGALARLHLDGAGGGFDFAIVVDDKASSSYIPHLEQGGLGLPDRDYYTKEDDDSQKLREKYRAHVARMFVLLGDGPRVAENNAAAVLAIESRLARASMTLVERRDPNAVYHKLTRAELDQQAAGFEWPTYLETVGVPASQTALLVRQPLFMKELGVMVREVSFDQWRAYLRWHLIHATAGRLSAAFVGENFGFYGQALTGTPELAPRWKRAQAATDNALGEAVGQLFVERAFSSQAKARALTLVGNLRAALRERIQKLDWMTESTKRQAFGKLDTFVVKIGYPDKWRDYSKLEISRDSYVLNVLAANRFETERNLAKLGRPVDRSEWQMNAHQVNAYYDPTTNEICFPAGILQPPFFDPEADDAVNYGAIGAVIGHEMTHGFDDQGSQYDADGNLKNWWTDDDKRAYESRQAIVVDQYDSYRPLADQAINGKLTLGENIADIGGLKIAYAAFEKSLAGQSRPAAVDGLAAEQRFFLGYAQAWHQLMRPEAQRVLLNTDPHSPSRFRVLGPLSDLPEFQQAFSCPDGAAMVRPPSARPAIW